MALSNDDLPLLPNPANAILGFAENFFCTFATMSSMPSSGSEVRAIGFVRSCAIFRVLATLPTTPHRARRLPLWLSDVSDVVKETRQSSPDPPHAPGCPAKTRTLLHPADDPGDRREGARSLPERAAQHG